jgi:uncharacterized protein YdbL (DUF1318 family)
MKSSFVRVLALAAGLFVTFGFTSLRGDDLNAVKARMEQRLPVLDQLKAKGEVGENNRGFVELRSSNVDAGDAVAAENRDRGMVYAEVAKQTSASVDQVGHFRARKIAAASAKGVWLQQEDGTWFKK